MNPKISDKVLCLFVNIVYRTLFFVLIFSAYCIGDEPEPNNSLKIVSKTFLNSAQYNRSGGNDKEDKAREELGAGEKVTLTLTGKRIGDVKKQSVRWSLEKGNHFATLIADAKDKTKAVLTVKGDINFNGEKNNGKPKSSDFVTVKVQTNIDERIIRKTFEIFVPTGIIANHSGKRDTRHPPDGDNNHPGCSSLLILNFLPFSVNFSNISMIERDLNDNDYKPEHIPGIIPRPITQLNDVRHDHVGFSYYNKRAQRWTELEELQNKDLVDATWKCGFYTSYNGRDCHLIGGGYYVQRIIGNYEGERRNGVREIRITISKFGCTVSRSTAGPARHQNS
ncbi:hypothetical protein ABFY27_06765 [Akkermansia massiliensis]